jgi:hypothetical protein
MPITRDVINIPFETLTPLSRSLFRLDIFTYQLRSLFMRGRETWDYLTKAVEVSFKGNVINIQGPYYDNLVQYNLGDGSIISNWKIIFENYMFRKGFIDALVQLRFISVNPITIYYKILSEEARGNFVGEVSQENVMMSELVIPKLRDKRMKIRDTLIDEKKLIREIEKPKYTFSRTTFSDGHVSIQRDSEYYRTITSECGSQAEGFVDETIPSSIKIVPDRDLPQGAVVNLFKGTPFFAFNYRNIYPKISDVNRMIESGLQVVFVNPIEGVSQRRVEEELVNFFNDWGIPIIDYVSQSRMTASSITPLISSEKTSLNIPNFFIIQRPIEKFHNSDWMAINNDRRRGLAGIPWAKDIASGVDIAQPQPDDGFLEYFVKEGLKRRLEGKTSLQVFFPLHTILTPSEMRKIITKIGGVLKTDLKYIVYPEQNVMGIYMRSMGEWILTRAVLRKYL